MGGRPGRPRLPAEVEARLWEAIRAGCSVEQAAGVAGVSRPVAYRRFRDRGGVLPALPPVTRSERAQALTFAEREDIARLRALRYGVRAIARELGRHPSTISRELRRIAPPTPASKQPMVYRPSTAQADADQKARRPKAAKLVRNPRLRREVARRLKRNHSPEQITRRLAEDFPDDAEMRVSHETIYQSLYVQARGALKRELTRHLRTGRTLRKPHRRTDQRRERFAGMVMISDRLPEDEDRAVPGNWEGDLILGSTASGSAVGTLVERSSRFVMLLHLPGGHTADIVQEAMVAKMATLPEQLRRSLTWDQGPELANHAQIAEATGLRIYFCDPHSPWQRGTNENTNGLLRQYLPKGSDLSFYGPGMLDNIADELNNRPRKTLNWRTPAEALDALLSGKSKPPGVATTS